MATSGTVATTIIDNSALIEHSFRRCGIPPSAQTPETVLIAKENLYLLLLGLSNAGLNLWAVEKAFIGLNVGQATYVTPAGTLDVLNVVFCTPTLATVTFVGIAAGGQATIASSAVIRVGFSFTSAFTGAIQIKSSGTLLTTLATESYVAGQYYWADLPVTTTGTVFTVVSAAATYPVISDIKLATAVAELPVTQWNRDTFAVINNKAVQGSPSTSYFYEKKLIPQITLWPVPNSADNHMMIYRHRQPQDVGTLLEQVEIPQRWMDGFIWLLSARLCFELPGIDPTKQTLIVQMADKVVLEAEQSETDGAPIYLTPGISCYSR
jgi:hypothetical protein